MWLWRTIARSPTPSPSGDTADGEEVEGAVEAPFAQAEVGGGDRRGEAVVEGLGQAEALVDRVPAEPDRQLVDAQLAGVEEAEQLDRVEVRLAERPELLGSVLLHVPGVVRLLRSGRRQRQQVRRRDVGDAALRQHRLEVLEDRAGILDVLDRLQEDSAVAWLGEAF